MKVKDLIGYLAKLPQDATVLVEGYEGGLEDVFPSSIKLEQVKRWGSKNYEYCGPHQLSYTDDGEECVSILRAAHVYTEEDIATYEGYPFSPNTPRYWEE